MKNCLKKLNSKYSTNISFKNSFLILLKCFNNSIFLKFWKYWNKIMMKFFLLIKYLVRKKVKFWKAITISLNGDLLINHLKLKKNFQKTVYLITMNQGLFLQRIFINSTKSKSKLSMILVKPPVKKRNKK